MVWSFGRGALFLPGAAVWAWAVVESTSLLAHSGSYAPACAERLGQVVPRYAGTPPLHHHTDD